MLRQGWKKCAAGAAMIALWTGSLTIQATFTPVYSNLASAVALDEGAYLLLAAMWLVVNNAVRAIFLYSGWFLFSDGIAEATGSKRVAWLLPLAAIPISYLCIPFLHFPSVPHFGVPAIITLTSVWILQYISRDVSRAGYKFSVQAVLVFSIQWLDLIPVLTPYGFGWGELSAAIKETAQLMEKDHLLNGVCSLIFVLNTAAALLLARLFVSYEKQIKQLRLLRQRERELTAMRTQQTRMRLYQEMHYLVHDLKRPLTTVLGLADLLSLSRDENTASHARAIVSAADKMDKMIGEIKNPDSMRETTVAELVNYTMAQVRVLPWGALVSVEIPPPLSQMKLTLNVIRISRVLVNILDNARRAASSANEPFVSLGAKASGSTLSFIIEDNGPGFVWPEKGAVSSWGSTGLGLAFAKKAVEGANGSIKHEKREGGGVRCSVTLPLAEKEAQQ
ncbi:MAG: HAMP domain-containing sensor histidine kinase [Cloacibacillus sp.]